MTSKGQPTQDDGKAGPSGPIQEEKDKRKDEARGYSGTSVQQKVKEKKKDISEKKTKGPKEKSRCTPKTVGNIEKISYI